MFNLILPRVNVRRQSAWYKDGEQQDMSPSDAQARSATLAGFAWSADAHMLPRGVCQVLSDCCLRGRSGADPGHCLTRRWASWKEEAARKRLQL